MLLFLKKHPFSELVWVRRKMERKVQSLLHPCAPRSTSSAPLTVNTARSPPGQPVRHIPMNARAHGAVPRHPASTAGSPWLPRSGLPYQDTRRPRARILQSVFTALRVPRYARPSFLAPAPSLRSGRSSRGRAFPRMSRRPDAPLRDADRPPPRARAHHGLPCVLEAP